jgi:hypothetical protein
MHRTAAEEKPGGLRKAILWRARGGARLSVALHAPHRHLKPRLISLDESGVTFRYKDYRRDGAERYRTMTSLIV